MKPTTYLLFAVILGMAGLYLLIDAWRYCASIALILLAGAVLFFLLFLLSKPEENGIGGMEIVYERQYMWQRLSDVEWKVYYSQMSLQQFRSQIDLLRKEVEKLKTTHEQQYMEHRLFDVEWKVYHTHLTFQQLHSQTNMLREEIEKLRTSYERQYVWQRLSDVEWKVYHSQNTVQQLHSQINALRDEMEKLARGELKVKKEKVVEEIKSPEITPVTPAVTPQPAPVQTTAEGLEQPKMESRVEEKKEIPQPVPPGIAVPHERHVPETPVTEQKTIFEEVVSRFEREKRKITSWEVYIGSRWAQIAGGALLTVGLILAGFYAAIGMNNVERTYSVLAVGIGILVLGEYITRATRYRRYGITLVISGFMNIYVFPVVGIYLEVFNLVQASAILAFFAGMNYSFAFLHRNGMLFAESILASYVVCISVLNYFNPLAHAIALPVAMLCATAITWYTQEPRLKIFQAYTALVFMALSASMLGILAVGVFITGSICILLLLHTLQRNVDITKEYFLSEDDLNVLWHLTYILLLLLPFLMYYTSATLLKSPEIKLLSICFNITFSAIIILGTVFGTLRKGIDLIIDLFLGLMAFWLLCGFVPYGYFNSLALLACLIFALYRSRITPQMSFGIAYAMLPLACANAVLYSTNYALLVTYALFLVCFVFVFAVSYLREKSEPDTSLSAVSMMASIITLILLEFFTYWFRYSSYVFSAFFAAVLYAYIIMDVLKKHKLNVGAKLVGIYLAFLANSILAFSPDMQELHGIIPLFFFSIYTIASALMIKEKISPEFFMLEDMPAIKHIPVFALGSLAFAYSSSASAYLPFLILAAGMLLYLLLASALKQGYVWLDILSMLFLVSVMRFVLAFPPLVFEAFIFLVFVSLLVHTILSGRAVKTDKWTALNEVMCILLLLFSLLTVTDYHVAGILISFIIVLLAVYLERPVSYVISYALLCAFCLHPISLLIVYSSEFLIFNALIAMFSMIPVVMAIYLRRSFNIYVFLASNILGVCAILFASNASAHALMLAMLYIIVLALYLRYRNAEIGASGTVMLFFALILTKLAIWLVNPAFSKLPLLYISGVEWTFEVLALCVAIFFVLISKRRLYTRGTKDFVMQYAPYLTAGILILPFLDMKNVIPVIILPLIVAISGARQKDFLNYLLGYLAFSFVVYFQMMRFADVAGAYRDSIIIAAKIVLLILSVLPLSIADFSRTYMRSRPMMNVNLVIANGMFLVVSLYFFDYTTLTTIAWVIFGAVVVFAGIMIKSLPGRLMGTMFILGAVCKAVFYDLISPVVDQRTRIVAFITAGIILFIVSYLYTKYGHRILKQG